MAIFRAATWPWASRMTGGTLHYKNLYSNTFGYTETQKKIAAGTATAILAASATTVGADQTITSGLSDPDVPRALSVTAGGTASAIQDSVVTVTGTNIEGKVISEAFRFATGSSATVNGGSAFRTVTSVNIDAQLDTTGTFSVGTTNKLGINHRLFPLNSTVKVYSATTAYSTLTLQNAPTVVANEIQVEKNLVTPATTPNGTTFLVICYTYDAWSDGTTINDQPEYSTTTSTSSTSSSTSTTTITTSTSSTSTSTSSTSTSTSSTSTSTSSTSTSTTTVP